MDLSIIISYYKALDNLELILKALNSQSYKNFEVIISEDDENLITDNFIKNSTSNYNFSIIHTKQKKDDGFRKCEMLNKSIRASTCEKLVFIDGDCIPHKHFVKSYVKLIKKGFFYCGRRVMLSEKISEQIKKSNQIKDLTFFKLLFSTSKKLKKEFIILFLRFLKIDGF